MYIQKLFCASLLLFYYVETSEWEKRIGEQHEHKSEKKEEE